MRVVVNEAAESIGIVDDEMFGVAPDRPAPAPLPLVDETAESILVTDENDDIVDASSSACELFGYDRSELIGRHLPDMETDPAQVGPRVRAARAGRPAHIEHRVIGKDGEIMELESVFAELRDGQRLSSHRDISPQLEIEGALQRSERRYRSLVTNATDLIFELDLSGRILFANSASQTLLGYSAADLRSLPFADLAADQTQSGRGAVTGWLQSAGEAGSLEFEARRKDGTIIWLDVAGRRVNDASGRPPTIVSIARDVTTAKFAEQVAEQARAVLARGEAQLRTALAPLPMMVFIFDADGRVIFAEGRVLDWIGIDSAFLAAQPIEAAPRMKAELRDGYERAMQGHDVHQVWHENGLTMDVRYVPQRQGGDIIVVVGLGFDTTERERQQQELARSRASLQRAQEAGQLGSWEVDTTTLGLTASDQARHIFGLRPDGEGEPLTAEDFWGRVHPDDLDSVRESFVAGGRAGQPSYLERRILQPNGEVRHVALRSERIADEQGSVTRVAGVVQDITERQRTIEALQASEQQLRSLVRTAPVIIFATDADGVFTMTDGKGLEEIDFAPDLRVGASALEAATAALGTAVARALDGEELSDTFKLGGLLFDHHYTPKRDARGEITGVVGVCVNVHEQRRLEAQLRQAKKMEAVERLAGGIAHDFNNVLSVITGYTELALLSVEESDPLYESLSEIKQAGQSAAALPRQLLAFSRRQVLEPEIVNLAEVVAELEPMLRRIIEEDVQIETDLNPIGCTV